MGSNFLLRNIMVVIGNSKGKSALEGGDWRARPRSRTNRQNFVVRHPGRVRPYLAPGTLVPDIQFLVSTDCTTLYLPGTVPVPHRRVVWHGKCGGAGVRSKYVRFLNHSGWQLGCTRPKNKSQNSNTPHNEDNQNDKATMATFGSSAFG